MAFINLHNHSTYSDGTLSPKELLDVVVKSNISYFSLTDHDIISGWNDIKENLQRTKIKFIYGIEISTRDHDYLHILAYNIDPNNKKFIDKLVDYRNRRIERITRIFKKLNNIGFKVSIEELNITDKASFGRVHIARLLKQKKLVKTIKEAFLKYLSEGCLAYEPPLGPDAKEAILAIKECGGIAVLAHPGAVNMDIDFKKFKDYGLDGIEAFYCSHTQKVTQEYINIAKNLALNITAGVDFHGPNTDRDKMYGFEYKEEYFNWLNDYFLGSL